MITQLQDLALAGVKWELEEAAFGQIQADIDSGAVVQTTERTRLASSVVPPIAPVVPVSVETAVSMSMRPTNIESLVRMISEFNHPLRSGATNVVMPNIAKCPSGLMVITDIPSNEDDASGHILTGKTGELFDKMLAAIGMSRDTVTITPLIFWRTPGGRTPTENELALSRPFVNRMINLLEPRIIITLGTLAAAQIAGIDLMKHHGDKIVLDNDVLVFPIYHPNYLMLKPTAKQSVWTVLQNVQNLLKNV
ncbi:MAG: uracil-DNA glycosylase [Alphaproteobacteria bacterium]|nr:uracil-DNA glycosylase [Alphaproteobacteria bacterium]